MFFVPATLISTCKRLRALTADNGAAVHVLRGRAELLQGDLRAEVVEREGLVLVRDVRPGVLLVGLHPLGAKLGDLGRARDLDQDCKIMMFYIRAP